MKRRKIGMNGERFVIYERIMNYLNFYSYICRESEPICMKKLLLPLTCCLFICSIHAQQPTKTVVLEQQWIKTQKNFVFRPLTLQKALDNDTLHLSMVNQPRVALEQAWDVHYDWEKDSATDSVSAFSALRSLINIVSIGGIFVQRTDLNHPRLRIMQDWINRNKHCIEQTSTNPYHHLFSWGTTLYKGNKLYVFLTGNYPKNGKILLRTNQQKLVKGEGRMATYLQYGDMVVLTVPHSAYPKDNIEVLTLTFDCPIADFPTNIVKGLTLSPKNAIPVYAYWGEDEPSVHRFTKANRWKVGLNRFNRLSLLYTQAEVGEKATVYVDDKPYRITLDAEYPNPRMKSDVKWGRTAFKQLRSDTIQSNLVKLSGMLQFDENETLSGDSLSVCTPDSSHYLVVRQTIHSGAAQKYIVKLDYPSNIEVVMNNRLLLKQYAYSKQLKRTFLLLNLKPGKNELFIGIKYCRRVPEGVFKIAPSDNQRTYRKAIDIMDVENRPQHTITLKGNASLYNQSEGSLQNIRIWLNPIAPKSVKQHKNDGICLMDEEE